MLHRPESDEDKDTSLLQGTARTSSNASQSSASDTSVALVPVTRSSAMGCCTWRAPEPTSRTVRANDAIANKDFVNNAITNTKYNVVTFIPKNLMEQFSRTMNRYFLVIACLQLFKDITPVNPLTTWLPLAVIFGVTAVKEAIDDYGRWKADNVANSRKYGVVRGGVRTLVASKDIGVGDIVHLKANDELPCDLVIISSSDPKGNCFIQTTNLDGESNLKVRSALEQTITFGNEAALGSFKGVVDCAAPNEHIYKFDSQLRVSPSSPVLALSSSQLLLQATHLRNTDWVYGLAVYTGNETKFGKNKKSPPTKYTRTDAFINNVSASIFVFQLLLVCIFGAVGDVWDQQTGHPSWYLQIASQASSPLYMVLIIPARFLLLNSTMIPISLKLTIDLCKLSYARFINADGHMWDEASDSGVISNSTALSEDLGQVKYVLTDKTGTLTENRMVLKVTTIVGRQYGIFDDTALDNLEPLHPAPSPQDALPPTPVGGMRSPGGRELPPSLAKAAAGGIMADQALYEAVMSESQRGMVGAGPLEFMRCLALNNDVVPAVAEDGSRHYKASSPDEESLVKSAQAYGVTLWEREGQALVIDVCGHKERYLQLACFEFSSDRKRMSVIVRDMSSQRLRLYCKGADDMIMVRLAPGQETLKQSTQQQIDRYATAGLRTLVMTYRDLSESEYSSFKAAFDAASAEMVDRDGAKERVYTQLEQHLVLIGATAIEDKLQDGVPETIALIKQAGVSFWMLTGDKFSTALTIARTCNLKPADNVLIEIAGETEAQIGASLDTAWGEISRMGYKLHYSELPTGWAACKASLRGRAGPVVPHRPNTALSALNASKASIVINPMAVTSGSSPSMSGKSGGRTVSPLRSSDFLVPFTVIVRGATLEVALLTFKHKLGAICLSADSVICCRVTPKQKGLLVKIVKDAGHLTLAIGDGGNDVAMIQEAAVGVGIRGKEGLQASRASDYQVPYFRALQRLLLVHGRYSYYRTSLVAQYSFYKSFLFCVMQIGFGFFSGYAGVSLFNSLCVAAYNVVVFVPIVYFMLDRDITQATALTQPQAYLMCSEGTLMTRRTMVVWLARGLWQAVVILLFALFGSSYAKSADYESMGLLIYFAYSWTQDLTMIFALRRVTWINALAIFGMHLLAFAGMYAVNLTTAFQSFIDVGSLSNTVSDPTFWLQHLLVTIACVVPVEAYRDYSAAFTNTFTNRLYWLDSVQEARMGAAAAAGAGGVGEAFKSNIAARDGPFVKLASSSSNTADLSDVSPMHPLLAFVTAPATAAILNPLNVKPALKGGAGNQPVSDDSRIDMDSKPARCGTNTHGRAIEMVHTVDSSDKDDLRPFDGRSSVAANTLSMYKSWQAPRPSTSAGVGTLGHVPPPPPPQTYVNPLQPH